MEKRKVSDIVYRQDLYPRIKQDPALVQRYAENIDVLPAIEINQHNELIDGWHRWTAHKSKECEEISVTVTKTASDNELFALAIDRNSKHGFQLTEKDKATCAIRLYNAGEGIDKERIAVLLGVTARSVSNYLSEIEKQLREKRKQIESFGCERQGLPVPEQDSFIRDQGQRPELEARGLGFHAGIMGPWRLLRQADEN